MSVGLLVLFLITATLYAAVGFGGGSTYNALLALNNVDFRILPSIALVCNIIVVIGGVWRFWRAGHVDLRRIGPFLLTSVPCAWLGGRLPVSEFVFVGLLGAALLLSGIWLLFIDDKTPHVGASRATSQSLPFAFGVGGAIGLLSGVVGIGGGIFLAPLLYMTKWGAPRQIAAGCSVFILANSVSGLVGQVAKLQDAELLALAAPFWPLPVAVLIGGQLGSWLGASRLDPVLIKRLTAVLILYVAAQLLWRWIGMM